MNKKFQLQFTHRLAVLLESGISLREALGLITQLEKRKRVAMVLNQILTDVEKGLSFSKSLTQSKQNFDKTLLSMITYGESAGILAASLRQALETLEKKDKIFKKLVGALIYPTFIALATTAMTLFLVMYIFPKIIPLFSSMNIKLPLLTRIVRGLYESISLYGIYVACSVIILAVIFFFLYKKKIEFRFNVQKIILKLPLLGFIFKKYFISASCRSIGTLLECGQTLPKSLFQISDSLSNELYVRAWKVICVKTNEGQPLSVSLRIFPEMFPALVPDMLSIGERTGSLASMCLQVSRMYEEELDDFVKQLGTIIEPVLMIGMGLIVGSVALSIILPIYEITNHLQQ